MKYLVTTLLVLVASFSAGGVSADVIRIKCGSVTADSCNDWYYTQGLNGAAHDPAGNAGDYFVGYTGAFQRRSTVTYYGVSVPKDAVIDSAYRKSLWITTDSTIKPVVYVYGWNSEAADTIVDSVRWAAAYAARTTAVDSMYDSLWARSTTAFTWTRTWDMKTILQELVNTAWWQTGDTAVFVAIPKAGTTGDRYFKQLNSNGGGDSLIVFYTPGGGQRWLIRQ